MPASAERHGMTAGVIGRLPRVGLIVVCDLPRHGHARLRGDLDAVGSRRHRLRRPPPPRPSRSSSPTCASRPTSSRRARSSRSGFAWRVEGSVPGFAANVVVSQSPAPGARVIADGAPIIVLRLSRNGSLRAGGRARERLPVRRQARPARRRGAAEARRPPRRQPRLPAPKPAKAGAEAEGHADGEARRRRRHAQARLHGRRRSRRAARRDRAQRPREAARGLGREAPAALARERRPLALPAQLDRHRRRASAGRTARRRCGR